jgi:TonB family protein
MSLRVIASMRNLVSRGLLAFALCGSILSTSLGPSLSVSATQSSLGELENKLKLQYATIEEVIAAPPRRIDHPNDYRMVLRAWQDRLASSFSDAAATVEEIIKINPANVEMWRERLETLRVYGQPIGPPGQRTVFGNGEVQKRAQVLEAPRAIYTDAARDNNISGDVRLRLILAADGSVRNIFPIKSLQNGLTESAMGAASQIKFQPAIRNGQLVSQFATFVYEFKKKDAKPYIPKTVF